MPSWTVDAPKRFDFDDVTALHVRLMAGSVAVLASDDRPSMVVTELKGRPLQVTQEGGELTISYEALSWEGLLGFLKPGHDSVAVTITVPADCPIQLRVLSAPAIVSGPRPGGAGKGMSGDVTLDGVAGNVEAETMSGEIAARDIDGEIRFKSMSGGLVLADGWLDRPAGNTMSGQIAADVALREGGDVHVNTMSGDVTLRLPAVSDVTVRLASTSGAVRSEFETLRAIKAPASH